MGWDGMSGEVGVEWWNECTIVEDSWCGRCGRFIEVVLVRKGVYCGCVVHDGWLGRWGLERF